MSLTGARARNGTGYSVVGERLVVRGDLDTDGTVRVDGRVEGVLHRVGVLIVGRGGVVEGTVEARDVTVAGAIRGAVHARGRLEIEPGASIEGDVQAHTLVLHERGTLEGMVAVGTPLPVTPAVPASGNRRLELSTPPAASKGGR